MTPFSLDPLTRFVILHTVLLMAGLIACALLRHRHNPATLTLIQRLTLAAVAASAVLSFAPLPRLEMPILPPVGEKAATPSRLLPSPRVSAFPSLSGKERAASETAIAPPAPRLSLPILGGVVWSIGVLFSLASLAVGVRHLRRLHQESRPNQDATLTEEWRRLTQENGVKAPDLRDYPGAVPFLAGLRHPALYLPAEGELRGDALSAALAHEAMHVARRDLLWNLAARIACALLWCQPLLWMLWRTMERTAEDACDEAAVQRGIAPRQYADLLLRLSEHSCPPLTVAAGMSAFRSQTGKRIARILKGQIMSPLTVRRRAVIACAVIAFSVSAALLSHARLSNAPSQANGGVTVTSSLTPTPMPYNEAEDIFRTSRHKRGPENASVAVIEFTDFECPGCRKAFHETTRTLGAGDDGVQLAVRHFPLSEIHKSALPMALATEAAAQQDKFWQARDVLMSGVPPAPAHILARLKTAGVDETLYRQAQRDSALEFAVREDIKIAEAFKISSTPTYLILTRRTKQTYLAIGAESLQETLKNLRTETHSSALLQDPLINYSCTNKPAGEVLSDVFKQAGVLYELPAGFNAAAPLTLDMKTARLSGFLSNLGQYMSPQWEAMVRADGVYQIQYIPNEEITGHVTLPEGISVENIYVQATLLEAYAADPKARRQDAPKTTIEKNGDFHITGCGPYPYRLEITDYAHEWIGDKFPTVKAKIGREVKAPAVRLVRAGFIEGTIKHADGSPFPHASLLVDAAFYAVHGLMSDASETDDQGKFRLVIAPGKRTVAIASRNIRWVHDATNTSGAYQSEGGMRLKSAYVIAGKTALLQDITLN